jgi:hypothetical protein
MNTMRLFSVLPYLLTALLSGCLAVDESRYKLFEQPDGGDDTADLVEACGDDATPLAGQLRDIIIDTTDSNNSTSSCGGSGTPGNDVFIALDVTAGEYWHFHLSVDPEDADPTARNPLIYVIPESSCGTASCGLFSNRCSDSPGDEHFAFVAPTSGIYYVGIDDGNAGGGRYRLQALRPVCGNALATGGSNEHGEACDDGSHCANGLACDPQASENVCIGIGDGQCRARSGDGCDDKCRLELTVSGATETGANDNIIEASLMTQNPFVIGGGIGGTFDCYPDVYAVRVTQGQSVSVSALQAPEQGVNPELPCSVGTNTPFSFRLTNNNGSVSFQSSNDVNGCPSVVRNDLDAGEYFITIDAEPGTDPEATYWMKVEVTN